VASTAGAAVVHVRPQGGSPRTLLRGHGGPLHAVACHPRGPLLATGGHSGVLKVYDYDTKLTVASRRYDSEKIQCLTYDPRGDWIIIVIIL